MNSYSLTVAKRDELSLEDGILLWNDRVAVQPQACDTVIEEAQVAHIGITRMKSLTCYLFDGLKFILIKVKNCGTSQKFKS